MVDDSKVGAHACRVHRNKMHLQPRISAFCLRPTWLDRPPAKRGGRGGGGGAREEREGAAANKGVANERNHYKPLYTIILFKITVSERRHVQNKSPAEVTQRCAAGLTRFSCMPLLFCILT